MRRSPWMACCGLLLLPTLVGAQDFRPLDDPPKAFHEGLRTERPAPRSAYGYPALDVDRLKLADLLRAGAYAELDARLGDLAARTRDDIRWEQHLSEAYRAFEVTDAGADAALAAWSERHPGSAAPHLARARQQLAHIYRLREKGKLIPELTEAYSGEEALVRPGDAAHAFVRGADEALERAIALDDEHYMRYLIGLEIQQQTGWRPRTVASLQEALRAYPLSSLLREQAALNSLPQWGGTVEIVRRIAADAAPLVDENPRLAVLVGFEALAEARLAELYMDNPAALAAQNRALEAGETVLFLSARALTYARVHDYVRVLEDVDRALELRPQDDFAVDWRAVSLYQIAFHAPADRRAELLEAAAGASALSAALDPGEDSRNGAAGFVERIADACATDAATCLDGYEPARPTAFLDGRGRRLGIVWRLGRDLAVLFGSFGLETGLPLLFMLGGSLLLWRRSGYWLPMYVHVLAVLSFAAIVYINWLWVRAGQPMWTRRYLLIAAFPLSVYFIFIAYGGLKGAVRRTQPELLGDEEGDVRREVRTARGKARSGPAALPMDAGPVPERD